MDCPEGSSSGKHRLTLQEWPWIDATQIRSHHDCSNTQLQSVFSTNIKQSMPLTLDSPMLPAQSSAWINHHVSPLCLLFSCTFIKHMLAEICIILRPWSSINTVAFALFNIHSFSHKGNWTIHLCNCCTKLMWSFTSNFDNSWLSLSLLSCLMIHSFNEWWDKLRANYYVFHWFVVQREEVHTSNRR